MPSSTYLPGVRNLDAAETKERRNSGWIGLALTLLAAGALAYFRPSAPWRLLLFFPVTIAAIGFLQAGTKFCVMVALSSRSPAKNAEERKKDRSKAIGLIVTAMTLGGLVAGGAYLMG